MAETGWIDKITDVIASCETEDQLNNASLWVLRVLAVKLVRGNISHLDAASHKSGFEVLADQARVRIRRSRLRLVKIG